MYFLSFIKLKQIPTLFSIFSKVKFSNSQFLPKSDIVVDLMIKFEKALKLSFWKVLNWRRVKWKLIAILKYSILSIDSYEIRKLIDSTLSYFYYIFYLWIIAIEEHFIFILSNICLWKAFNLAIYWAEQSKPFSNVISIEDNFAVLKAKVVKWFIILRIFRSSDDFL